MMNSNELMQLLQAVRDKKRDIHEVARELTQYSKQVEQLGFSTLDIQRESRKGFPEVIYGEGKTVPQLRSIMERLMVHHHTVFATRVSMKKAEELQKQLSSIQYDPTSRILYWQRKGQSNAQHAGTVAILCAGTSDLPVAEEAALSAELLNQQALRIYDVGVAGLHRLINRLPQIMTADVVVVVAGMEGALPSVMAGLIDKPVIAVPTSIGYGTSFHGVTALLSMLNSCSSGISVVNIDNGFGAAYQAALITKGIRDYQNRREVDDHESSSL